MTLGIKERYYTYSNSDSLLSGSLFSQCYGLVWNKNCVLTQISKATRKVENSLQPMSKIIKIYTHRRGKKGERVDRLMSNILVTN